MVLQQSNDSQTLQYGYTYRYIGYGGMPVYRILIMFFTALFLSGCLTTSGHVAVQDGNTRVAVSFNDHDRRLIHDYYHQKRKRLPPGLAKKRKLPPGLAKRQTLPPGLRGRTLPGDLVSRLSPIPDTYIRLRVGTDIVIMNRKTRVIFDVISGIN